MENLTEQVAKLLDEMEFSYDFDEEQNGFFLEFRMDNTDVDIIPVAINSGFFWRKNSFLRYPGKIIFEFLEPMPKGLDKKEFMVCLQKRIEDKCAELDAETLKNYPEAKKFFENSL